MILTHHIAIFFIILSIGITIFLGLALAFLVQQRFKLENAVGQKKTEQTRIFRQLAAMLSGKTTLINSSPAAELQAISRMTTMVRGEDRDRLMAYSAEKGLFKNSLDALNHASSRRRIDAVRQLQRFDCKICLDALNHSLHNDNDQMVRLEAALALSMTNHLPTPKELIEALDLRHGKPNRVHMALFRALATRYGKELLRLSGDINYANLFPMFIESLGWTQNLAMVAKLAKYANNNNPENRTAAIKAARHMGHPAAGKWIVPMLNDKAPQVRIQAARACGELRLKDAIPKLETLMYDQEWWVRTRARGALEILSPNTILKVTPKKIKKWQSYNRARL